MYPADAVEETQTRRWIAGWRATAEALDRVKAEELRDLSEAESGRMFEAMAFDPDTMWISPERRDPTGLIEQQRLFLTSNEHPARHQRRP